MDASAFNGLGAAMALMLWSWIVSVPLAIWKLIDIGIWLFNHIHIYWQ